MFLEPFASDVANGFVSEIHNVCERIEIVGSLRRRKSIVNDIDILLIPKTVEVHDSTHLEGKTTISLLDARISQLDKAGRLVMERNGPRMKRFSMACDDDMIGIDLYIATPDSWWTHLLIRTGSRAHNMLLGLAAADQKMQLKGDGSGLIGPNGGSVPVQSEEEIFDILNVPYRTPEERE